MYRTLVLCTVFLAGFKWTGYAQLTAGNRLLLREQEQMLSPLAFNIVNGITEEQRREANDKFVPVFVNALKIKGSFYYPFDSIKQISIVYPQDTSFRVFTWAVSGTAGEYRYYGAIQLRTTDGILKLFPFFDNSEFTRDAADTITDNKAWIGCVYYNIIDTRANGKKYYTLFGWQGNNYRSHKKLLDVLSFTDGKPVFGAPLFSFAKDSVPGATTNRFFIEYQTDASVGLNYDADLKMIIYDHLVPLGNQSGEKYTYVPDGTYDGFKWEKDKWVHVKQPFNTATTPTPFPAPVNFKKNILEKDAVKTGKSSVE